MQYEPARLLTGATDGIGLALARRWDARGIACFFHGRRSFADPAAGLDTTLFHERNYVEADLARPDGPQAVARKLAERGVERLELLVLNAGVGWFGAPAHQASAATRAVVEVDLLAPMRLVHLLLPLLERARGRIAFISSIAALLPSPRFAVYAAAKAAAEGFFRSLRVELEDRVDVQVIRPGAVRTQMHAKSGASPEEIGWERFPSPEDVAQRIDRLLEGPPVWRTLGAANRALGSLGRNLPRVVERLQARREGGG